MRAIEAVDLSLRGAVGTRSDRLRASAAFPLIVAAAPVLRVVRFILNRIACAFEVAADAFHGVAASQQCERSNKQRHREAYRFHR
jgi:hypothetical protein